MLMVVTDVFTENDIDSKAVKIENPAYVPTVGSRVFLGYTPAPLVKDVLYDYTHQMIIVKCE